MPFKLFSDVRETSNTIGTGDLVLAGAVSGYWAFAAAGKYADTDTMHVEVRMGTDRELMKATYNSGANSLTRTQIYASTNGGAAVNWGAGAKDIFVTNIAPSDLDAAGKAALFGTFASGPWGQCQLTKSGANLLLSPYNGSYLFIGGLFYPIPLAGVTLAPPATTNTLYYIYAYMNSGVMTLEASTTAPAADATYGNQIKTGDGSRALVGMAYTRTNAWLDTAAARFVISYFNRRNLGLLNWFTTSRTTSSASFVEINSEIRCEFLTWADEAVSIGMNGLFKNSVVSTGIAACVAFDGATDDDFGQYTQTPVAGYWSGLSGSGVKSGLAAGYHYATLCGLGPNTTTFAGSGSAGIDQRCSLNLGIRG